jgi:anthranilate phosphoribosyltransferase
LRWNAGVYLWFAGQSASLEAGLERAQEMLQNGSALTALHQLQAWSKSLTMR